jgi:hypothetical protein
MLTEDLWDTVLLDPFLKEGCDELFMVVGYSSASFLRKHLDFIKTNKREVTINLIRGINRSDDHLAYLEVLNDFAGSFNGYYYKGIGEVHSKTYSWYKNGRPLIGFSGSANYSQKAFTPRLQQNQMVCHDATKLFDYFNNILGSSEKIQDHVPQPVEDEVIRYIHGGSSLPPGEGVWIEKNKSVRISILSKDPKIFGEVANTDSLNWGFRRTGNRDKNEACLNIRGDGKTNGFLPPHDFTFTLLTDDGKAFDCKRYQAGGKAISTTYANKEIGIYFRNRLNIPLGTFVTKEHLINYGRTDFVLTKINEDTFSLDFSV